jgi:eukaryotic-like serine/threonine-protein kinase
MPNEIEPERNASTTLAAQEAGANRKDDSAPQRTMTSEGVLRRPDHRDIPQALRERYDDIRFLGEGGMGTVFRAYDPRLGRTVALKVLKRVDAELMSRFLQEARAQARIQHENVCRVYDTGEASGEPFIAMQFIDGLSLGRAKDEMTLEQKVMLMRQVCLAVHEAHRLGLIHRDIKPGNILVEKQDDGSFKPYIMDFGLAREVADEGQTATGAVLGTPAYMAPEQAKGDVRSLDRRSDVYSLGATLYELLAGRPPFVAENSWKLLIAVAYEEAPTLSTVRKDVPAELEIVTMKCLEREPGRRYDSARAFAEDLQRYLDGEPILAKRAGFFYVVLKKAQKNKAATALIVMACVLVILLFGVWRKGKRDIVEQARLAQELGKDVTEMELFLRNAYTIPLHDVERERDLVRRRLAAIEKKMAMAGDVGKAPGDYALGRGYLALDEAEKAREHLMRASTAGYASPDLDYALGRALGELYRKALENAKRIQDPKEQAAKIAQIEKEYRDPALVHLRAALPAQIEVPAYAEGLIAYYEGKYEDALGKAKKAFEQAPWLYEAKRLEGDAYFMLGSRFRHDADFDWDKMMEHFGPAGEAYRNASEIARSAPDVHGAECELWFQIMYGFASKRESPIAAFEKAKAACERSVKASSRNKKASLQLGHVHSGFAFQISTGGPGGTDDPLPYINEAIKRTAEASQANPDEPMAHFIQGNANWAKISYDMGRGIDPGDAFERALSAYATAARLDPRFLWPVTEGAQVRWQKMLRDAWLGVDLAPSVPEAVGLSERAIVLDDKSPIGPYVKGLPHLTLAEQLVDTGRSPEEQLQLTSEGANASMSLAPKALLPIVLLFRIERVRITYTIDSGADQTTSIAKAKSYLDEAIKLAPESSDTYEMVAAMAYLEALYDVDQQRDPSANIEKARASLDKAIKNDPRNLTNHVARARIEIVALRWSIKQQKAKAEMFEAARKPLESLLSTDRDDPSIYQTLAEIHAIEAAWIVAAHQDPAAAIAKGLSAVAKALAKNSHMASALATKAALHLADAQSTKDAAVRSAAAKNAKEAFESAFKSNPLLKRKYDGDLTLVTNLLNTP